MDHYRRLEEWSQKIDLLIARHSSHSSFPPTQPVYSSPTHFISECPVANQFSESRYDHFYQDQTRMTYTPGNNPDFHDYNSGWGAQPDFSWESHPVVTPALQHSEFVDPYYDMPYHQSQPSQATYSPSFEEKITQLLHFHTQSIAKLETQIGQLATAFSRREEEEELPSQAENNLEEPYPIENFNYPLAFPEQSLGNDLVIEQPCTTNRTDQDNLTREEIYTEESDWWDEPLLSSPYLSMDPFPSTLDSSNFLNGKGEQIGAMMELTETSHEPQVNDTIREAIPIIHHQNSLDPYMAQCGVDNFDANKYDIEVKNLEEIPCIEPAPSLIERYEPPPSSPIDPLLESPPICELEPLPVKPTDTLPVIFNQEVQLSGILNTYKEAVGWDISKMRDPDFEIFKLDFSIFGTTFENCLQNLTKLLARCMETGLVLIWGECQDFNQYGVQLKHDIPENEFRQDPILINEIHKPPPPFSDQQTRLLNHKDHYNIFKPCLIMLAQFTLLIGATRRRTLYGRFSAMMTRPPDWPCLVRILRDVCNFIIINTFS